ncbi:hypothetical protein PV10_02123 [Exophiala mesophila]|uniref:Glutathione S-transferase kappa n=1 Tax=Exophiala mesophila TaxID=212818 RepID=A0A0D1ZK98_EXOME|nr:uncharacterized protein PV10_02123 [Exophiala mesophila]KIV94349.1 hypothetical protein PV10_02123 [Exophiala mesophila]
MAKKITLFVDIVSPFGYLAYYMLRTSPIFQNVEITYVPILLGGLMKLCDNRPPLMIRNKGTWINTERLRWAQQFNIPMATTVPEGFPKPTLHLQRFLTALNLTRPDLLPTALDACYKALWTDPTESNLPDVKVFAPIVAKVIGEDVVKDCVAKMATSDVKNELMAQTERAVNLGAFGIPWFQCTNESGVEEGFWGFDHLGQVVRFLGLDGSLDQRGEVRAVL